ncbi:MAG: hypothetical protein NZ551_07080 [Microscillaceae bacterium]|nr:hypothetical protein [Microscillaceae bacterium]MDW8460956.1 hypothetical protein [Cytophagales bacterium]
MKKYLLLILLYGAGFFCLTAHAQDEKKTEKTEKATVDSPKPNVPDTVKIGAFVNNIYDLSMTNGECSASVWVWLVYKSDTLKISENFEVINAKTAQRVSTTTERVDGLNWITTKIMGKLQQDWFVHNFPFDTQKIVIKLESSLYDMRSMVFKADVEGSKIDKNFALAGWDIKKFEIINNPSEYDTNYGDPSIKGEKSRYSAVDIVITIKRQSWGLFFKVFLGLYIALLISSLVFLVPSNDLNSKFGLAIGGLFAAVGNKYIVDSVLPETNVFTLCDQIHALTFSFIFFYILISAIFHELDKRGKTELTVKLERICLFAGPLLYAILNFILITRA